MWILYRPPVKWIVDFLDGRIFVARAVMVIGGLAGTIGLLYVLGYLPWPEHASTPKLIAPTTISVPITTPTPASTPAPTPSPTPTLNSLLEAAESIRTSDHEDRALRLVAETAVERGDYDVAVKAGKASFRSETTSTILAFVALCAASEGLFDLAIEAANAIPTTTIHDLVVMEILVVRSSQISDSIQGMYVECPGRDLATPDRP